MVHLSDSPPTRAGALLGCTSRLRSRWVDQTPLDVRCDPRTGQPFNQHTIKKINALCVLKKWMHDYKKRQQPTRAQMPGDIKIRSTIGNLQITSPQEHVAGLRVKAHQLSDQEFAALGVDAEFWYQGDEALHGAEMLKKRMMLRKHPLVVHQIARWLMLVEQPVTHAEYTRLMVCIYKAIVRPRWRDRAGEFDEADARACAEEDWQSDSDDGFLSTRSYLDGMFQLADHWTATVTAEAYARWLHVLLGLIASGGRLKALDEISHAGIGALVGRPLPNGDDPSARYEEELERLRRYVLLPPKIPVHHTDRPLARASRNHFLHPLGSSRNPGLDGLADENASKRHVSARASPHNGSFGALQAPSASGRPSTSGSVSARPSTSSSTAHAIGLPPAMPARVKSRGGVFALIQALGASQDRSGVVMLGLDAARRRDGAMRASAFRPDFRERALVQRSVAREWVRHQGGDVRAARRVKPS